MGRDCCYGVCLEWIVWCLSICSLKRSRSVRSVSPIYCFLHLLHWIIYVRFAESQVMWCLICLVSPVLVKVYDNVWAGEQSGLELQWIVPAGGLGALSLFASFAQTSRSRRFGERYPTCQKLFMRGFRFRPTKPSSPTHARKNLRYPREGEWQKATTGTSLKMFLKRSVDCRMGCFLRSMSWMLGRAGL